ncbi:DNA topoisomerase IV, alpha subunit [Coniochaeta sp. PMI_546]|nr:DNA topoisomerase IV, alpha subunit [Coniochaeta sp. PMI_546]
MEYDHTVALQHAESGAARLLSASGVSGSSANSGNVAILPHRESQLSQAGTVISKIEMIFESILDALANGADNLSIPYRTRTATSRSRRAPDVDGASTPGARPEGRINFPGRTPHEANKFASLLRILEISREAIATGAVVTKRNIFYQNIDLFKHQRVVDSLVDDLAFTLGVGRDDLNIVAAAKGLIAGPIVLTMRNNSVIPCGLSHESGTLIPTPKLIRKIDFGLTEWILVIEKEATFRTLAAAGYHTKSLAGHGILLTGKGFPDLATRSFLNIIHSVRPHVPMYALVDYDPDGLSIMRTYQVGSTSLLHEEHTISPPLRWLGIRSDQILPSTQSAENSLSTARSQCSDNGLLQSNRTPRPTNARSAPLEALSQLTPRDRRMATGMLQGIRQEPGVSDADEMDQVRELQMMLMLNIKAEIQAVDNLGDITHWLDERLCW